MVPCSLFWQFVEQNKVIIQYKKDLKKESELYK